jgi:hypothetical protein
MADLESESAQLAARVAQECRALRLLINGNAVDLSSLTTTTKTSLVAAINELAAGGPGGGGTWGSITGTLSAQTDLQNALNAKQETLTNYSQISGLTGYPTSFPPAAHTHPSADLTDASRTLSYGKARLWAARHEVSFTSAEDGPQVAVFDPETLTAATADGDCVVAFVSGAWRMTYTNSLAVDEYAEFTGTGADVEATDPWTLDWGFYNATHGITDLSLTAVDATCHNATISGTTSIPAGATWTYGSGAAGAHLDALGAGATGRDLFSAVTVAQALLALNQVIVVKTADEILTDVALGGRTLSTDYAPDAELKNIWLDANGIYAFEWCILGKSPTTEYLKSKFVYPTLLFNVVSGNSFGTVQWGNGTTLTYANSTTAISPLAHVGANQIRGMRGWATLVVGGSGGYLSYEWGKTADGPGESTILRGSFMSVRKLN